MCKENFVLTRFCTLFSGSSGNAVYLSTEQGAILIDCGMSGKQTIDALRAVELAPEEIRAILITHEHSDHIKGAGVLARKLNIPIYATEGTWAGMESCTGNVPEHHRIVISAGESFFLDELEIEPFSIPHDAADPVGYRIYTPRTSVAVATDLGYFADSVRDAVMGAEVVLLESNHDPKMLEENPHYPAHLKRRILGRKGHLSNQSSAEAAVELCRGGTKHLLLGHLSSENNDPHLAYRTVGTALRAAGAELGGDVTLNVAGRYQVSHMYTMK